MFYQKIEGETLFDLHLYWVCIFSPIQQVVWKPLALELSRRGHRVTFVGPAPDHELDSHPGITYDFVASDVDRVINSTEVLSGKYPVNTITDMNRLAVEVQGKAFGLPIVQKMLEELGPSSSHLQCFLFISKLFHLTP